MLRSVLPLLLLAVAGCGDDVGARTFSSDVEECKTRLRTIYEGLLGYATANGHAPEGSGVAFFAELVAGGTWPNDAEHARLLTCPGVSIEELGLAEKPPTEWFANLAGLGAASSAYAGRDQEHHPLAAFPGRGTEALLACDNHLRANHAGGVTNVLMADGSVLTLELEHEQELGNVPADATVIVVGPDSPLAELRTLRQD